MSHVKPAEHVSSQLAFHRNGNGTVVTRGTHPRFTDCTDALTHDVFRDNSTVLYSIVQYSSTVAFESNLQWSLEYI